MSYFRVLTMLKMMRSVILLENEKWYLELSRGEDRPAEQIEAAELDNQRDILLARIEMNKERIDRINGALLRIESGDYGNCTDCREAIAEARLQAMPFAHRCMKCEQKAEDRAGRNYQTGVGRFK